MKKLVVLAAVTVVVVGGLGLSYAASQYVADDPGVAACKAMALRQDNPNSEQPEDKWTEHDFQQIRKQFSGSEHADIRTNGLALVDFLYANQDIANGDNISDERALELLPQLGQLQAAINGLSGACSEHAGVKLDLMEDVQQPATAADGVGGLDLTGSPITSSPSAQPAPADRPTVDELMTRQGHRRPPPPQPVEEPTRPDPEPQPPAPPVVEEPEPPAAPPPHFCGDGHVHPHCDPEPVNPSHRP